LQGAEVYDWLTEVGGGQKLNSVLPRFELNNVASRFHHVLVTLARIGATSHPLAQADICRGRAMLSVGKVLPRNPSRGLILAISGHAGSISQHFDLSSSADLYRPIGITADFSAAAAFFFEALSKAVNSQQLWRQTHNNMASEE
jgi:hypothetical protein